MFRLCEQLAKLLGDKEAIADLSYLYGRHPEMFKNMQEVSSVIAEVVKEPEIIVDANRDNKDYKVIKAVKVLNHEKMADVVIKNESGTNEIFHTNKKRIKEFERLQRQVETGGRDAHFLHPDLKSAWAGLGKHSPAKENLLQVETPTLSTHQLNGLELMDKNSSGANALSATTTIIPQTTNQYQSTEDPILQRALELQTKQQKGELENFFTHQEGN
ncbi:hypothetical protein, partial [Helicobacter monodelphidis]|uniref:hypothetical protein n=1 Tax=Helicobacter sp. 15-1451 TaxID=2004995 RepID=UPI00215CD51D